MPTPNGTEELGADAAVAGLAEQDPLAALLWTWSIAAADEHGILPGDPHAYAALVAPALQLEPERVGAVIDAQAAAGLITVYEVAGRRLIYLHHHHQERQPAPANSRPAQFGDAAVTEARQSEGLPGPAPRLPQLRHSGRDRSDPRIRRAAEALQEAGVVEDAELTAERLRKAFEVLPGWEAYLDAEVEELVVRGRVGDHVRLSYLPLNIRRRLAAAKKEQARAAEGDAKREAQREHVARGWARSLLAEWPVDQVRAIMADSGYSVEAIDAALKAAGGDGDE